MTRAHKKFEMLCALAAVERLSEKDLQDLTNHCLCCECCRRRLAEAEAVSQEYFLLFADHSKKNTALPSGARDKFLQRASVLGIPLSSGNSTNRLVQLPIGVFVVAVIALFLCKTLITSHDRPHDTPSNGLSSARTLPPPPLNLTNAGAPVAVSVRIPGKHRHTTERFALQVSHERYRTQFQFSPQLSLTRDIAISKEPLAFKLSLPVNWDTFRPIPGKTFALTSLPQLWPEDDPASRDKHIAHFDLPALFSKNSKTQ